MNKKFEYEFIDEAYQSAISYEYDEEGDIEEKMEVLVVDGVPTMYANQKALMTLAKLFIKMSLCEYTDGFHLHLRKDFDGDKPETFLVILNRD